VLPSKLILLKLTFSLVPGPLLLLASVALKYGFSFSSHLLSQPTVGNQGLPLTPLFSSEIITEERSGHHCVLISPSDFRGWLDNDAFLSVFLLLK
jgi:hypothetical protein